MRLCRSTVLFAALAACVGCHRGSPVFEPDHPHLTPQIRVLDTTIHSAALGRDMPLRLIVPADPAFAEQELPVVYFLHGAGTNLHDWTNHSDTAGFAARGFVLVFPDAPGSYYIDDLRSSHNRYEQYLTEEVAAAVHDSVPTATRRPQSTAIVGISRGGYGAAVIGLKHPELFGFIGSLSGALDLAQRGFRWNAPLVSEDVQRAFGTKGGPTRLDNDPYRLAAKLQHDQAPFFFIACGQSDSLYALSQRFVHLLGAHHLDAESHFAPGSHNWSFWSAQISALERSLETHLLASRPLQPPASPGASR